MVLAFSGGLDTSYCVKYLLHEQQLEVHTALVDTGGFRPDELAAIEARAYALGAATHRTLDRTQDFYERAVRYLIFGNVLRNQTYPLSVSAERMFQALAIAEYARQLGATYVAHGSTGAGNDQVRFDLALQVLAPEVQILTPIRDQRLSRQQEIDYLQQHGVEANWEKAKYSVNQGLWGTSVGGAETLTSNQPLPEAAFPTPQTADTPRRVALRFAAGEIVGIDGDPYAPVAAIQQLATLAAPYGIGRDVHVGDTIIGIKGRVGFEAAAPLILLKAHHALEKHVLTKWQQYWKEQLANWYGMMLHEGQFLDPVMRNIEAFLADTQQPVTGQVFVALHPYRFAVEGIASDYDLMNPAFGAYGEMNQGWTGEDVKGFTKVMANALRIRHAVHQQADTKNSATDA